MVNRMRRKWFMRLSWYHIHWLVFSVCVILTVGWTWIVTDKFDLIEVCRMSFRHFVNLCGLKSESVSMNIVGYSQLEISFSRWGFFVKNTKIFHIVVLPSQRPAKASAWMRIEWPPSTGPYSQRELLRKRSQKPPVSIFDNILNLLVNKKAKDEICTLQ